MPETTRHLVVVLGDQLDAKSSALDGFEPATDRLWMAEVADESEHVWSSKPRTALNLKLLDPREVVSAAEAAYRAGRAPLAGVEGFIRQVLG